MLLWARWHIKGNCCTGQTSTQLTFETQKSNAAETTLVVTMHFGIQKTDAAETTLFGTVHFGTQRERRSRENTFCH